MTIVDTEDFQTAMNFAIKVFNKGAEASDDNRLEAYYKYEGKQMRIVCEEISEEEVPDEYG